MKDVLETGANLVYVVEHEGKEVLLPVIPECVKNVDVSAGIVTVHIMEGISVKNKYELSCNDIISGYDHQCDVREHYRQSIKSRLFGAGSCQYSRFCG